MKVKIKNEVKDITVEELFLEIKPFCFKVSKKYFKIPEDEFWSICNLSFAKAIQHYNVESDKAFLTLFGLILERDCIKSIQKEKDIVIQPLVICTKDNELIWNEEAYQDNLSQDAYRNIEGMEVINSVIAKLTEKQQLSFKMRYIDDAKNTEIAKRLGMSQMAVSAVLKRAVRDFKKFYREVQAL